MTAEDDPHDLDRFLLAQKDSFLQALAEIRSGQKQSHWMWYIFPQFDGLGFSSMSRRYAIKNAAEARAYLRHPVLGPRLAQCCEAAVAVDGRSAAKVFGSPDDMKLRSCATLFAAVSPPGSVFEQVLDRFFHGARDGQTVRLLSLPHYSDSSAWSQNALTRDGRRCIRRRARRAWWPRRARVSAHRLGIS